MKFKRRVIGALLLASLFITSIVAYAASESFDGGSGYWYGGITDNHVIYSKVWDRKVDGRRYNVTVWVKDDNGDRDEVTGTTNGVDAAGEVKVTKTASYNHLFTPNKAGYKNLSVITNYSMDNYNEMYIAPIPTEFEANLWDELQ